jgi:4-hydroxy-tetrahydrodipicolinate synthase
VAKPLTIRGLFPAASVPFDDELNLIEHEFIDLIQHIGAADGVGGVAVNGHAGELTTLSAAERARVIQLAREYMPSDKLVISGIEDLSTSGSIDKLKAARDAGADAALVLPTFDYLPRRNLTQTWEAPYRYFEAISTAGVPMVVFEYPQMTGISYTTDTLVRLADIEMVVAIKDTVANSQLYQEHLELVQPKLPILTAIDSPDLLGFMLLGCDGALIGVSQIGPEYWGRYVNHVLNDEVVEARDLFKARLLPLVTHVYSGRFHSIGSHNSKAKEALVQMGIFSTNHVRPPELDVQESDIEHIRVGLERANLARVFVPA